VAIEPTLALGNGVLLFGFFALVAVLTGYAIWSWSSVSASSDFDGVLVPGYGASDEHG
jgi:hypothetical protein